MPFRAERGEGQSGAKVNRGKGAKGQRGDNTKLVLHELARCVTVGTGILLREQAPGLTAEQKPTPHRANRVNPNEVHLTLNPLGRAQMKASWMTRLASSHGLSYAALCKYTWPRRTFWKTDVDLVADDALISSVSAHTGIRVARVEATTVAGLRGWLFPEAKRYGVMAWVLPAGLGWVKTTARDPRPRRPYVRQYCPLCLAADPEPYFRLAWRLAFVTLCEQHGVELVERCPRCEGPVAPTLSDRLLVADAQTEHRATRCRKASTSPSLHRRIASGGRLEVGILGECTARATRRSRIRCRRPRASRPSTRRRAAVSRRRRAPRLSPCPRCVPPRPRPPPAPSRSSPG